MPVTYEKISGTTLSSATSSFQITSIPATYTDFRVILYSATGAAFDDEFLVRINGDTGSNYSITYLTGDGTTASSGRASSASEMNFYNQSTSIFSTNIIQIIN